MRLKARQSVTARTLTLTRLHRGFGGQALSLGKREEKSPRSRHNFQMLAGEPSPRDAAVVCGKGSIPL